MNSQLVEAPTGELIVPAIATGEANRVRLSLVIPTLEEAHNIAALLAELEALLEPVLGDAYELIVVDDDSQDRTWAVALGVASARVRVIRRTAERGLGTAVIRGWQVARGDIIGVMDGDLQHPPETNLALLREIERGASLATASRHVDGGGVSDWSLSRRLLSRGAQLIGLLVLPGVLRRLSDPMSGYFMLRRAVISGVPLDPVGYKILIEVVSRGSVGELSEVGYEFRERANGDSKITKRVCLQYLHQLLKLRWDAARR